MNCGYQLGHDRANLHQTVYLQILGAYANVPRNRKSLTSPFGSCPVDTPETKARTFLRREGVARSRDLERAGVSRAMIAKLV